MYVINDDIVNETTKKFLDSAKKYPASKSLINTPLIKYQKENIMKRLFVLIFLLSLVGCFHKPIANVNVPVKVSSNTVNVPIDNTAGVVVIKDSATVNVEDNKVGINDSKAGVNDNTIRDNEVTVNNRIEVSSGTVAEVISTLKPWQFISLLIAGIICFVIYSKRRKQ